MTRVFRRLTPLLLLVVSLLQLGAGPAANVAATLQPGVDSAHATLQIQFTVPPGLHAQSHTPLDDSLIPLTVKLDPAPGIQFDSPQYPAPQIENYPALGKVSIYTGTIDVAVPLALNGPALSSAPTITGAVHYQACNDDSCFPPKTVHFQTGAAATVAPPTTLPTTAPASVNVHSPPPVVPTSNSPTIFGHDIATIGTPFLFAAAFLIGIIFNAVPCVLPVVPLKIIGFYEASHHDRRKSVLLGTVFSVGLIASFGILAVLILVLRVLDWGGLFQHTWFTILIVAVLTIMAVSQFGFFTVNLPTFAYNFTPRHDTYRGNFLFGMLTALLSTPCTIGPFVGLLAWASKQPAAEGVASIMTVGAGMAFPYFILSGFPEVARRFPRVGPWAELIKQEMGFLLLVAAVFFAQPLLPSFIADRVFWWGLFAVVAAAAVFLMVRTVALSPRALPRLVASAVAMLVIVPTAYAARQLTTQPYQWHPYSDAALATARATGNPVLIDFTATWCGNCHYVEAFVLNDPRILRAVDHGHVIMLKADVTDDTAPARPLLSKLNPAGAIPLTALYLPGQTDPRLLTGIYSVADLHQLLSDHGG